MIKNMKVRRALILGFGTTIVISVFIAVITLMSLNTQSERYKSVIETDIRCDSLLLESRLNANIAARIVRNMALSPGDSGNASLESNANEALQTLHRNLEELQTLYTRDNKAEEYAQAVEEWESVLPRIITAVNNNQGLEAVNLIRTECTPRLNQMASIAEELNQILETDQQDRIDAQQRNVNLTIIIVASILVIATLAVIILNLKIIRDILEPVREVRESLMGFSQGNLNIPVTFESKNELGDMCRALQTSQHVLSSVIGDICYLLEEMGRGNFNVRSKDTTMYVGALESVLKSIRDINSGLSDTLAQVNLSSEQVSAGAEQVSTGAQALAQGATEQASAVQQLSATISEISSRSNENAQSSATAMEHSQNAGDQVSESAKYMDEMVQAMAKISDSSEEIGKIIATIENIAFQTNILALNAAVEAARAGSAGKGFAVVADEVRNLATKSDQAAKATKELIDSSINSVHDGSEIVKKVSESLNRTVEASAMTMAAIREIAKAVSEESSAIAQVTEGIDQISSVVQTNSATSEESAAASEELSSQAALLKELMSKFTLRNEGSHSPLLAAPATPYHAVEEQTDFGDYDSSPFSKY